MKNVKLQKFSFILSILFLFLCLSQSFFGYPFRKKVDFQKLTKIQQDGKIFRYKIPHKYRGELCQKTAFLLKNDAKFAKKIKSKKILQLYGQNRYRLNANSDRKSVV